MSQRKTILSYFKKIDQPPSNLKNPEHDDQPPPTTQLSSIDASVENRLRLKIMIRTCKLIAMQGMDFDGRDEFLESSNAGNFTEMIKLAANLNEEIAKVFLENSTNDVKYISPAIQKEILKILANKVRSRIREEVGDSKFGILINDVFDDSFGEQVTVILRFVDCEGYVRERFLEVVGVDDTTTLNIKREVSNVLARHDLQIQDMRGQWYNGASDMCDAWNGLHTTFIKECPYAYFVHCFAQQLQLTLVAECKNVSENWNFFSKLGVIVNLVSASPKHLAEFKLPRELENANVLVSGATSWSSQFGSINRLIGMFEEMCTFLENLIENGFTSRTRAEAHGAYKEMVLFEFVFVLLLMNEVMSITDLLCQTLQRNSQDMLNIWGLVSSTKILLQKLKEDGWDDFLQKVTSYCKEHDIDMPDMSARYKKGTNRFCDQQGCITTEHHYHACIFNATIDSHLAVLNSRFTEQAMELLVLSSALNPIDHFQSFKVDDICKLAERFYPQDFTQTELRDLRRQLIEFEHDVIRDEMFQNMSSLSELCRRLVETRKSTSFYLINRLIRFLLTLPAFTSTTERVFSAMELFKARLHETMDKDKMDNEFLADSMVVYIERELAGNIKSDSIVDDFYCLENHRAQL